MLQSVKSGDMSSAQTEATAIQGLISGSSSSTSSTSSSDSTQSTFLTDLNSLLNAVQSGDTSTSQTAANTLVSDLQNAAGTSQAASTGAEPSHGHGGGHRHAFADDLTNLVQAVQSGDMTSARTAATALQGLIDGSNPSSSSSSSTSSSGASSGQSTFTTDLNNVLSAVQSGDATNSQSAVNTMITRSSDRGGASPEYAVQWNRSATPPMASGVRCIASPFIPENALAFIRDRQIAGANVGDDPG